MTSRWSGRQGGRLSFSGLDLGLSIRAEEGASKTHLFLPERPDHADKTALTTAKYRILREIGAGGMGTVYEALDHDLNRTVALKHSHQASIDSDKPRFVLEAQATGQLVHPNIVPIHDIGATADGEAFFTMRLVRGRSLRAVIEDLSAGRAAAVHEYSLTRLLQVYQQVCRGMAYAHGKGMVHLDLKPDNIMLGGFGEVLVLDWGLARTVNKGKISKRVHDLLSTASGSGGTPRYMSPEQVLGRAQVVDHRSDIYSLGVLLYQILTLESPYVARTWEELKHAITSEPPVAPGRRNPARPVDSELERICLRAMAKSPDDRFASARDLGGDVQAFLEGERETQSRRKKAQRLLAHGEKMASALTDLKRETAELERRAGSSRAAFKPWEGAGKKRPFWVLRKQVREHRARISDAFNETANALSESLALNPADTRSRRLLADLYYERFVEADKTSDMENREFFLNLVEQHDDGSYGRKIHGKAKLRVETDPPGAAATLYRYVERDLVLTPSDPVAMGRTPAEARDLQAGSYVVELALSGFRTCVYPVLFEPNADRHARIKLYTDEEIGDDFVYVPAGPFICGGGEAAKRTIRTLNDFFIMKRHITQAEYLEFIRDLDARRPREAQRRVPRDLEGGPYWKRGRAGCFELPTRETSDDEFEADWPVFAVSVQDVDAYIRWRSERDGRRYFLPTLDEWEKAARSVDGRTYPWGSRWEPTFCNCAESKLRPYPCSVMAHPRDVSPYGMYDASGNVSDFTRGTTERAPGARVTRGGLWDKDHPHVELASISHVMTGVGTGMSFRLVHYSGFLPRVNTNRGRTIKRTDFKIRA